jgi:DNA-binding MarR family transcriptional regulator
MMTNTDRIRQVLRTDAFDELVANRLGINPTDLRCLEAVIAEPGITPSRLANISGLTTGAVTGVVDRLVRAGYVSRRPDPTDRRSVTIQPVTDRAEEVLAAVAPLSAAIERLLTEASARDRDVIARFVVGAGQAIDDETARMRAATRGGFVDDVFTAPLGDASRGRLVFASGAPRFALNVAPLGPRAAARVIAESTASRLEFSGTAPAGDLVVARFEGPRPDVKVGGGSLTVRYRRAASAAFSTRRAMIALSGEIPWTIELGGGLTALTGSLAKVKLERMDVEGGANHIDLALPRPFGTAVVRIGGVVSSARFRRPPSIPVAVRLAGGVSRFRVDGGKREQVGGQRRYIGAGFDDSPDRYELEVLGGASDVTID